MNLQTILVLVSVILMALFAFGLSPSWVSLGWIGLSVFAASFIPKRV